jgi:hypothetical protein
MSNLRFIEISSAYRNRARYPKPSQFEVPFSPPPLNRQIEQVKAVYNDNQQIITRSTSVIDPVLNGIIEYMWSGTTILNGNIYYNGSGSGTLESTNSATIDHNMPAYDGSLNLKLIVIRNSNNTVVAVEKTSNSFIKIDNYLQFGFSNYISLIDDYNFYRYYAYPYYANVLSSSTTSSVSVSGLSSVYQTIPDYYIGYLLTIYNPLESSSLIIGYNPSTCTFILQTVLAATPTVGSYITITDPSTNAVITLPGVDACGKSILDYTQSYNGYYIVNETRSSGSNIMSSKISSYNYIIRAATLETPFASWAISDKYTIRKTLPNEFLTTTTPPIITGKVTGQSNPNTITLHTPQNISTLNYKGFKLIIPDATPSTHFVTSFTYTPNNNITIDGVYMYTAKIKVSIEITHLAPTLLPTYALPTFTIHPIFNKVGDSPQLSLTTPDCIFLGSSANSADNYYTGQYIYIYPPEVTNSQTKPLTNIQGSCFYIMAYIGSGYNACFIKSVDTPCVDGNTQYYPSYTNAMLSMPPVPGTLINIVSLARENYVPLMYNGSTVSQNEYVAYELSLVSLNMPNISLITGSSIAYYPYVYVEFSVKNNQSPNLIYSNNPESNKAVFQVAIRDIKDKNITPFVKMSGRSMTQTIKFKPNDCLVFSVFLPNGKLFETVANDFYCPSGTNPFVQIDALVGIDRVA